MASPSGLIQPNDIAVRVARRGGLALLRAGGLLVGLLVGYLVLGWVATMLLTPATAGVANSVGVGFQVPPAVELAGLDQTSTMYAADGTVLAVLHDEVDRTLVDLEQIPPHVQNAILAAEDQRFYEHDGYDVEGLGRAFLENVQSRDVNQGGSTITQQLAKSEVGDEVSLQRKLAEIAFARALEAQSSKEEILGRYLNQVYFGSGAYGIQAAAEEFYSKDVGELTVAEAATLAGLIRSPGSTNPREFSDIALRRRDATLAAMVEQGWLPQEQLAVEQAAALGIVDKVINEPADPYIAEAVKQEFYTLEEFGADRLERNEQLLNGGLEIQTSFDPRLQQIARESVLTYFPESTPTGALASVDPRTGQIRAIFGGTDFDTEQFNFATQGRRQPGSSWKPFVMTTALEIGFSPSMTLTGTSPTTFDIGLADDKWRTEGVQNYGGASYGDLTMDQALIRSVNTAFAELMLIVGPENVVSLAQSLGINTGAATAGIINPSIALGGLEVGVTPLEMAGAYSAFANAGAFVEPSLIDRVTDKQGNVLFERNVVPTQVIDPAVNQVMVDTMKQVICCGTAPNANISSIGWNAAGKTGTAQGNADAWFAGYTPVLATAVWTGHPEARIAMPGATGGNLPARVWHDFMIRALEGVEPIPFPTQPPAGLVPEQAEEGEVVVPDVRGTQEFDALRELADIGLAGVQNQVASGTAKGTVLSQQPRAGTVITSGTQISLGVSTGEAPEPPKPAPQTESAEPAAPEPAAPEPAAPDVEPSAAPAETAPPAAEPDPPPAAPAPPPAAPAPPPANEPPPQAPPPPEPVVAPPDWAPG